MDYEYKFNDLNNENIDELYEKIKNESKLELVYRVNIKVDDIISYFIHVKYKDVNKRFESVGIVSKITRHYIFIKPLRENIILNNTYYVYNYDDINDPNEIFNDERKFKILYNRYVYRHKKNINYYITIF